MDIIRRNPYRDNKVNIKIEGLELKYGIKKTDSSTVAELGIFGISGMGKTTLIKKILSLYPQMILHTNYKGDKTVKYQIPWLKVETPSKCGIKSLSLNILKEIDNLFGEENYYKKGNAKKEYEQVIYLKDVFEIHSVGLLVIDEIQNIRGIASKESDKIMRFFVELSNVIDVPIVLIGTLKALPLFATEMKNCRRIAESKPMYQSPNDDEWKAFMKALFKLQWTKYPVEATEELLDLIYEESQGITDIAVKLFTFAQLRAMYSGTEKITKGVIRSVASDSLIPLRPLLKALRSNKEQELMKYEDLYDSSKFFKSYAEQERNKVGTYEWNQVKDVAMEDGGSKDYYTMRVISSFLTQMGIAEKITVKNAKEVIRIHGVDTDISSLKRYAFELCIAKPTQANKVKPKLKLIRSETPNSGMLNVHGKSGEEDIAGYEELKECRLYRLKR